ARADGLVDMGLAELGYDEEVPVVATGGLAELVSAYSRRITHVDKFLTLKGLQLMDAAVQAAGEGV
ncbi:MAG: type III pantothenate kinase, partial [Eggerthellaceae bacterium]|nr:type III pantothenate kinase [Eggerthellaceae bacterium]